MAPRTRRPLTRDRVLAAALKLADAGGFESLSMRNVAKQLGVEAMSLYNHVANKEDLVDGLIDIVFGEIEFPAPARPIGRSPCARERSRSARHSTAIAGPSG